MAAFAFPSIDPIAVQIGPLAIRWYGLAYLAGLLAAWWVLKVLDERWDMGLGPDGRASAVIAAAVGIIVGGRLGYVLVYGAGAYWKEPLRIFAIWDGGMSFHGGLAGILLAAVWVSRRYRIPFLRLCDAGAVGAPIGFFFGRVANFVNQELWGRLTDVPWGVVFPKAGTLPRHPSQLYEAGLEGLVLFAIMWLLARRRRGDGALLGWMLIMYGAFRIFVEFFREPDVQIGFIAGGLTMGQILSVPLVIVGAWLAWRAAGDRSGASGEDAPAGGPQRSEEPPSAETPVEEPSASASPSDGELPEASPEALPPSEAPPS